MLVIMCRVEGNFGRERYIGHGDVIGSRGLVNIMKVTIRERERVSRLGEM